MVRAVHIEVAQSFDSDSFLNSFRRSIARRVTSQQMRSDNDGNFVSGESEVSRFINSWNQENTADLLRQRNVQWIFNPPRWLVSWLRVGMLNSDSKEGIECIG